MSARTADLEALAEKYRELTRLRDERDGGADVAPKEHLVALARRFPGALRELEVLPAEVLDRRARELAVVARGDAPVQMWMQVVLEWHACWRESLSRKAQGHREDGTSARTTPEQVGARLGISGAEVRRLLFSGDG